MRARGPDVVVSLGASGVSFAYPGPVPAVEDVTLGLGTGELVVVIGPNGAGKSTLLKLMAGVLAPDRGEVRLGDERVDALAPRVRARRVAIVPQSLDRVPSVAVHDFVLGGRYGHLGAFGRAGSRDHEAVDEALASCDVADVATRSLHGLSGGQRQRVLVARALAQEASMVLVDEPTSSLDPEHQIAVFDLLATLTCEGRGVLVVTHDLNLASQFATGIALLRDGRLVAKGGVEDVLRREVLEGVYGGHLRYGEFPAPRGAGTRPFVVPWLGGEG